MGIEIVLDEFENRVEPIKLANEIINLVNDGHLSVTNVKEIVAYLSVYTRYNTPDPNSIGMEPLKRI